MKSDGKGNSLLTTQNSAVILIDHQPQMAFGVASIDRQTLINNVTGLAKAAKILLAGVEARRSLSGCRFCEFAWRRLLRFMR